MVGTLAVGVTAVVRSAGVVEPVGVPWRVEWWIGAEDRWHRPAVEPSARQRALPGVPVVETAVRVPGGDITARTAGVMGPGGTSWTVVEVSNRSAVPVALGWTVQGGTTALGPGVVHRIDGRRVVLGRSPRSIEAPSALIPGTDELTGAVAVQPLAHTAIGWLAIEGGGTASEFGAAGPLEDAERLTFPPLDRVVAGWAPFDEIGAQLSFGDDVLQTTFDADRAVVRLAGDGGDAGADPLGAALIARAGALAGADAVVRARLELLGDLRRRKGSVRGDDELVVTLSALRAWCASVWRGVAEPEDLVLPIAAAANWLVKRVRRSDRQRPEVVDAIVAAVGEAVATLAANDQVAAATKLAGALAAMPIGATGSARPVVDPVVVPVATPSGSPTVSASAVAHNVMAGAAARCGAAADVMAGFGGAGIELLPGWSPAWWGRAIEVHDLPTPWGALSFALRWHGERPALLWEIVGGPSSLEISAPALDPRWRSSGRTGEELLGAVERPAIVSFS